MAVNEQKLALGTVQFGLPYGVANKGAAVSKEEARAILGEALALGIDTLDTAIGYGQSESVLGEIGVAGLRVVSKLPGLPTGIADVSRWVREQLHASLARLGVPQLHGLLLHRPADLLGERGPELYRSLCSVRDEGLSRKIGISVYSPDELESLFARYDFSMVQAPLNILDRRLVESGWAERLQASGVETHVRSAFLQGLLLMPASERPARFARFDPVWECWQNWLRRTGLSPVQACLRYALSQPVSRVVVGVDSQAQLKDLAAAASGGLQDFPAWPSGVDGRLLNPAEWNTL